MKVVIRVLGTLIGLLGLAVLAVGVTAAAWIRTDDTVTLPAQPVRTDGVAIVTSSGMINRFGPTLVVRATSGGTSPLWVGVAHQSDLDSYLTGRAVTQIASIGARGALQTHDVTGKNAVAVPAGRDWWLASATGPDPTMTWRTTDGHYGLAVMRADGKPGLAGEVTVGLQLAGLFRSALLVSAVGLGLVFLAMLGFVLTRSRRRPTTIGQPRTPTPMLAGPTE